MKKIFVIIKYDCPYPDDGEWSVNILDAYTLEEDAKRTKKLLELNNKDDDITYKIEPIMVVGWDVI